MSQLGHVRLVTFGARSGRHNPPAGVRLWQRALILGRQINKFGRVRLLLAASVAPNPNLLRGKFSTEITKHTTDGQLSGYFRT